MLDILTAMTRLPHHRGRRRPAKPGPRDALDELIDAQLARESVQYTPTRGQRCPHPWCDQDWHILPITATRAQMRRVYGRLDPGYLPSTDTSPVVCPGSGSTATTFTPPLSPTAPQSAPGQD